jgi:hypothetical protein
MGVVVGRDESSSEAAVVTAVMSSKAIRLRSF